MRPPRRGPRRTPTTSTWPFGRTQANALMHIYEELSQHLGHVELTRDILRTAATGGP